MRYFGFALRKGIADYASPFRPIPLAAAVTSLNLSLDVTVAVKRLASSTLVTLEVYSETPLSYSNFGFLLETLRRFVSRSYGSERLHISSSVADPSIIVHTPPNLVHLEYEWCGARLGPVFDEFRSLFSSPSTSLPFRTFRLTVWPDDPRPDEKDAATEALAAVCATKRVELDLNRDWDAYTVPERTHIPFFWYPSPAHLARVPFECPVVAVFREK
ncbi:hypothetical protein JCM10295v2_006972 [Rhodotorula toruloides]